MSLIIHDFRFLFFPLVLKTRARTNEFDLAGVASRFIDATGVFSLGACYPAKTRTRRESISDGRHRSIETRKLAAPRFFFLGSWLGENVLPFLSLRKDRLRIATAIVERIERFQLPSRLLQVLAIARPQLRRSLRPIGLSFSLPFARATLPVENFARTRDQFRDKFPYPPPPPPNSWSWKGEWTSRRG